MTLNIDALRIELQAAQESANKAEVAASRSFLVTSTHTVLGALERAAVARLVADCLLTVLNTYENRSENIAPRIVQLAVKAERGSQYPPHRTRSAGYGGAARKLISIGWASTADGERILKESPIGN